MKNFIIFILFLFSCFLYGIYEATMESFIETKVDLQDEIERSVKLQLRIKELKELSNRKHNHIQDCDKRIVSSIKFICSKLIEKAKQETIEEIK